MIVSCGVVRKSLFESFNRCVDSRNLFCDNFGSPAFADKTDKLAVCAFKRLVSSGFGVVLFAFVKDCTSCRSCSIERTGEGNGFGLGFLTYRALKGFAVCNGVAGGLIAADCNVRFGNEVVRRS